MTVSDKDKELTTCRKRLLTAKEQYQTLSQQLRTTRNHVHEANSSLQSQKSRLVMEGGLEEGGEGRGGEGRGGEGRGARGGIVSLSLQFVCYALLFECVCFCI